MITWLSVRPLHKPSELYDPLYNKLDFCSIIGYAYNSGKSWSHYFFDPLKAQLKRSNFYGIRWCEYRIRHIFWKVRKCHHCNFEDLIDRSRPLDTTSLGFLFGMTTEALISAASIGGNLLLTWFTRPNKRNQTIPIVNQVNNTVVISLFDDSQQRDWKCVAAAFIASTGLLSLILLLLLIHCLIYHRRNRDPRTVERDGSIAP